MRTIEYRTKDKSTWGPGPWQDEPDKKQWLDKFTHLPCMIRRANGAWCGYVGVPRSHPLFESQNLDDLNVHGGVTFSGKCRPGDENDAICHVVDPGEDDDVFWIGFDCNHAWDIDPERAVRELALGLLSRADDVYRDQQYVEGECLKLARQLADMAKPK